MKYRILLNRSPYQIEQEVNDLISEGWLPQGGICRVEEDGYLYQAMIKQ